MRHTIRFSLAGLILAASSSSLLSADLDRENVDVERYVLDYALSLDAEDAPRNSLSGSVTIRFRNKSPKAIDAVPIVLNRLMRYESAHDGEGRELEIRNRLVEMANFEYYQANAGVALANTQLGPLGAQAFSILLAMALLAGINATMMAGFSFFRSS